MYRRGRWAGEGGVFWWVLYFCRVMRVRVGGCCGLGGDRLFPGSRAVGSPLL